MAIQPMPPVDGSLDATNNGSSGTSVWRGMHALHHRLCAADAGAGSPMSWSKNSVPPLIPKGEAMSILQADAEYGEGFNHWLQRHGACDALGASAALVGGARHRSSAV